ncbi:MAG TPA: LytTR family DNA-binding domain-containing protein [Ferruginibacter sp.]|nr:LytTR family DNA-binding domain-containing protein [Ferruginibacter sp.]
MLRAVILDDESNCSKTMELLLKEYCPQVSLLQSFNEPLKALDFLQQHSIDLLFLDVDMPVMNGFELLDKIQMVNFHIIFTTAYDQYAIKAFKYSAYDYLLKPIDEAELASAVGRLLNRKQPDESQAAYLLSVYNNKNTTPERIALPTTDSFEFIDTPDILRCESDSNYTRIFFVSNKKELLVCRTLKDIEKILGTELFVRVHNSHLINKKQVKKLVKTDGGYLLMSDGATVPVARSKRNSILQDLL